MTTPSSPSPQPLFPNRGRTPSITTVREQRSALVGEVRERLDAAVRAAAPVVHGTVTDAVGLGVRVRGIRAGVGQLVTVRTAAGPLPAQVVAVHSDDRGESATCMPLGATAGIATGDEVVPARAAPQVPAGPGLLGRIVDALGRPLDGAGPLRDVEHVSLDLLDRVAPNPLHRRRVDTVLTTGVRALDAFVPLGAGQRVGIMAGSGVGKSTLLGMAVRGTAAPVRVVALVGERGREVREFLEETLDAVGRARTVVVVATGDDAAHAPAHGRLHRHPDRRVVPRPRASTSCSSSTPSPAPRMAQREVGLAAGEPPATRGYPASVFAMLPRLLERAGPATTGSITALYTVLVEGDDLQDPIGDTVRGILDGHVVLDRALATAGHFPSIAVLESVSRVDRAVLPRTGSR